MSATLTASGASTYSWSTTDVISTIFVMLIVSVIQYIVIATDLNNCENISISTVNALPTISVNSEAICTGNSATLIASGASTYMWSSTDLN